MNDLLTDQLHELASTLAVPPTSPDDDLRRGRRRLRRTRALAGGTAAVVVAAVAAGAALTVPHLHSGRAVEPPIVAAAPSSPAPSLSDVPSPPGNAPAPDACHGYDRESKEAPQARIAGARELGSLDLGPTTVHIFGNGSKYVTCDAWRGYGEMTLFRARAVDAPLGKEWFRMSMDFQNSGASEYVAGGLLPKGVSAISYRFPRHAPVAAMIGDRIWAVAYFPKKQIADGAEVTVEVKTATGTRTYQLKVGEDDFCMQVNHGC